MAESWGGGVGSAELTDGALEVGPDGTLELRGRLLQGSLELEGAAEDEGMADEDEGTADEEATDETDDGRADEVEGAADDEGTTELDGTGQTGTNSGSLQSVGTCLTLRMKTSALLGSFCQAMVRMKSPDWSSWTLRGFHVWNPSPGVLPLKKYSL